MSLGPTELIIILVIILVIFGAGKLPQVFSSLGKGVREFREASEGPEKPETPNVPPPVVTTTSTPTAMPPVVPTNTSPQEQTKK
jgi:sec-independent protein translocase protein TatA